MVVASSQVGEAPCNVLVVTAPAFNTEALKASLRGVPEHWGITYVESAREALSRITSGDFHAAILDEDVELDEGSDLVEAIHSRFRTLPRIVVSDTTESKRAYQRHPHAHFVVSKRTGLPKLASRLKRVLTLKPLLNADKVKALIGSEIPGPPPVHAAMAEVMRTGDASIAEVTELVESQPAVAKATLELACSKLLGRAESLDSIETAARYFGVRTMKSIVWAADIKNHFTPNEDRPEIPYRWLATGVLAQRIALGNEAQEVAFQAGVMHDFGKIVIQAHASADNWRELVKQSRKRKVPLQRVEHDLFGVTHADVAACLLAHWGYPYKIIQAVERHHKRPPRAQAVLTPNGAVYLAAALTESVARGAMRFRGETANTVDGEYVASIGAGKSLAKWEELAERFKYSAFKE